MADIEQYEAREKLRERFNAVSESYAVVNNGSNVPVSEVEASYLRKKQPDSKATLEGVREAIGNGQWSLGLKRLFGVIFGKDTAVDGLGYFTENVDSTPLEKRVGLIKQLELAGSKQDKPTGKFKRSILKADLALSLDKSGYVRAGSKEPSTVIEVRSGERLADVLRRAPSVGKDRWEELSQPARDASEPAGPAVLGPLSHAGPLPSGFLYLSDDGYPLYVVPEKAKRLDALPAVPFYRRKTEKELERDRNKTEFQRRMELLQSSLEEGDILLVSQDADEQGAHWNLLYRMIRRFSAKESIERQFPHVHAAVYTGGGAATHVLNDGGAQNLPISAASFGPGKLYRQVTVVRASASRGERAKFADEVLHYAGLKGGGKRKQFNAAGLVSQGLTGEDKTAGDDDCACIDLVSEAAERMAKGKSASPAWQALRKVSTPLDTLRMGTDAVLSLDFGA